MLKNSTDRKIRKKTKRNTEKAEMHILKAPNWSQSHKVLCHRCQRQNILQKVCGSEQGRQQEKNEVMTLEETEEIETDKSTDMITEKKHMSDRKK